MSHQEEWTIAMDWWKSYESMGALGGVTVRDMIRNLATEQLQSELCEGEGIGSSDINHAVFYIHKSWIAYTNYCVEHKEDINIISFLMEEMGEFC